MNPPTPPSLPRSLIRELGQDPKPLERTALYATCDRIVAALTRRLAEAARNLDHACPSADHDFLVPVLHPDMAEPLRSTR